MRGWVLARWRVIGATSSLRVLPPGEDTEWIVERYRAVIRPWGTASAVMFDIERVRCDVQGFRVDAVNLWGNCRPDVDPITLETQARIDAKAAQVQNARP